MARFGSTASFVVNHKRYKAGQIYADTKANAVGSDVVWTGMSSATMSPGLVPLDASATTMYNASRFAGVSPPTIDGVNSIEA
jgi:hypothetical protein